MFIHIVVCLCLRQAQNATRRPLNGKATARLPKQTGLNISRGSRVGGPQVNEFEHVGELGLYGTYTGEGHKWTSQRWSRRDSRCEQTRKHTTENIASQQLGLQAVKLNTEFFQFIFTLH